jgi:integrase-like protein
VDTAVTQRTRKRWKDQGIEPITLHACRHTCASLLIAAGVPAKAVQSHLGHSPIRFFPSMESGDNMILATDYPLLEVFWTILIFVAFAVWIYLRRGVRRHLPSTRRVRLGQGPMDRLCHRDPVSRRVHLSPRRKATGWINAPSSGDRAAPTLECDEGGPLRWHALAVTKDRPGRRRRTSCCTLGWISVVSASRSA